ncbi:hypothetical protein L3X38_022904 [Prunus dulcis]|uniref:GAG-pre-integrase domain-containing protein n=1 Tax=Prunus dulcis TaxID=3755 RepID=A0AAD4VWY0_PRUDU|nr:hypothetical protein L3X38_022904 [Prunus dulcis]
MPNLSDSEYQQILTTMNDKKEPQANSAGLGYEEDDWSGYTAKRSYYYLVSLASDKPSLLQPSYNHTHASTHLWHSCLGHPSSSRLQFLAKNVLNFPFSNNACEVHMVISHAT